MSRAPGVNATLVLPAPPERYDVVDQRETRRLIVEASRRLPQWAAVASIPAPVTEVSTHTVVEVQQVFNPARSTVVITTASLADLASEVSNIVLPFTSGALLTIAVDRSCWVRFYSTAADQTADSTRVQGTLGTAGTGLLAEFQCSAGAQTIHVSPVAILANDDTVLAKTVYYTIKNKSGGPHTVIVTMNVLKLEA